MNMFSRSSSRGRNGARSSSGEETIRPSGSLRGGSASHELVRLLFSADAMMPLDWGALRGDLLDYCRQDTWAMVRLLDRLRALAASA